jgi:hypothetical protein
MVEDEEGPVVLRSLRGRSPKPPLLLLLLLLLLDMLLC